MIGTSVFNLFHATGLFLYTLITSENQSRLWQINDLVMYVRVPLFYIVYFFNVLILYLTYFHIKMYVYIKQKISYLHSSSMQTILVVKLIKWLCY